MKILISMIFLTSVFTCERPAPQMPKVIYSHTKIIQPKTTDSISSNKREIIEISSDSLALDSIQPNQE